MTPAAQSRTLFTVVVKRPRAGRTRAGCLVDAVVDVWYAVFLWQIRVREEPGDRSSREDTDTARPMLLI